ncbi:hypothetical protein Y032_0787g2351 [Ancylostoma ceylanicum]|uniref:DNA2/NAM7 helicase-like C-terminal domain-containing protein n=1 Tax=Ancylostoma ceylanicum TaxID=53326 RepID=A0A016WCD6_9BILA|nr:hypothetical protein Y032_0787g2351 [Ancylostoma ceylanicum]
MELTEQEKDDFMTAEQDVCETLEAMIELMFRLVAPRIICITTSSLLNTTDKGGIFKGYVNTFDLLIGDEASQIPEPVFMAIASRLEGARHIYIGDVRQLEPYARRSRLANPARFGARSIIDTLLTARAVPIAPLVTTFRAHPALNSLPNTFAHELTLVNGIRAVDRQLLAGVVRFPNPAVPFVFADVKGTSVKSACHSHYNPAEASVCQALVRGMLERGVDSSSIAIIAFYKEQHRYLEDFAKETGIDISTVDSVQGRERDVVFLLTTKTDSDPDASVFLDAPRRMNVALTRCRHGQMVLGHRPSLARLPQWQRVINWALDRMAVIPDADVQLLFGDQ